MPEVFDNLKIHAAGGGGSLMEIENPRPLSSNAPRHSVPGRFRFWALVRPVGFALWPSAPVASVMAAPAPSPRAIPSNRQAHR